MNTQSAEKPVPSPCVNICELGPGDICIACHRSGREISLWGRMSSEEKRAVWALIRRREQGEPV
jgi:predicted Fe-S protein YdhL (DUF1289 family)